MKPTTITSRTTKAANEACHAGRRSEDGEFYQCEIHPECARGLRRVTHRREPAPVAAAAQCQDSDRVHRDDGSEERNHRVQRARFQPEYLG